LYCANEKERKKERKKKKKKKKKKEKKVQTIGSDRHPRIQSKQS